MRWTSRKRKNTTAYLLTRERTGMRNSIRSSREKKPSQRQHTLQASLSSRQKWSACWINKEYIRAYRSTAKLPIYTANPLVNHNKSISRGAPASPGKGKMYEDNNRPLLWDIQSKTEAASSLNDTERKTRWAHNQDFAEWPGNNQSHRRRERAGISDGNKRLSKKISGERKVIKMERADFKLKEVTSRIGPTSYI